MSSILFHESLLFLLITLSIFSAEDFTYGGFDDENLLIRLKSDGSVRWVLPLHLTTTCDVSIKRFPYDSQACFIEIFFFGLNGEDAVANLTREVIPLILQLLQNIIVNV